MWVVIFPFVFSSKWSLQSFKPTFIWQSDSSPAQVGRFKTEVSQTLQHLFLTWPLQSSTLSSRCIHSHNTYSLQQKHMQFSINCNFVQSCLAHVLRSCVWSFFVYSYCRKAGSPYDWAGRQPQPTRSCFASRVFCPVSLQSGQRQLELATKPTSYPVLHIPWSTVAGQKDKTCYLGNTALT